ncbi:ferric reductase-like transmembrane domain-containing protein [Novispirillum sp. DQ9]|uniref:ferredoxin reductase family protein n=1 Tax=Novispirillum sp. DQ9 TaxID=3398612 RepID=UPI003C7AF41C
MRTIKIAFGLFFLVLLSAWAVTAAVPQATVFSWRGTMVDLTGVLGMGAMSLAMILALRPAVLEPVLGGLDKGYRLHKWLGITGLVVSIVHWLWVQGPKWAVGWGLLERPQRGPRVPLDSALFEFLRSQRGLAEGIGEWAFYGAAVLIVVALVKVVPYGWFRRLHRLIPVAYLALVFHAVVLMRPEAWTGPLGVVMAVLLAGGTVAAVASLTGRIGRRRSAKGTIAALAPLPADAGVEVTVALAGRWPGHDAGQFAFVTFETREGKPREGAHPFTISSAWRDDGRLTFLIKALGDYTATLGETLRVGDAVTVEGPYGRFDFAGAADRPQIWVAGGIGITPFLARLQALAETPQEAGPVDLYYCTSLADEGFLARLRGLAEAARVRLHVLRDPADGRLDSARLCGEVPGWRTADVWFCGPAAFGHALRRGLRAQGLPPRAFHQELFEMR